MSFNKFFPDRVPTPEPADPANVLRARVLRLMWVVSTLMLVTGYVIAALVLTGRI